MDGYRLSLATNAERVCAEIMLNQKLRSASVLGCAGLRSVGIDGFTVNLGARFVDHDDRKRAIPDSGIASEPPCEFLAVLDRTTGRGKFQSRSVPDGNTVLQVGVRIAFPVAASIRTRIFFAFVSTNRTDRVDPDGKPGNSS
jgi:hypothetical protein